MLFVSLFTFVFHQAFAQTDSIRIIRKTYPIDSISRVNATGVVTVTLEAASPHDNLKVGQKIRVWGCTNANFNMAAGTNAAITEVTSTTVFKYVQAGVDETESTSPGSVGGDYTLLSLWVAGEQKNITAAGTNEIAIAECYNDWASGLDDTVNIDGFTTDSTHYVKITVPVSERHDGTAGSGFFIDPTTEGTVITISDNYTVVEWVEITGFTVADFTYAYAIYMGDNAGVTVQNNIIHDPAAGVNKRYVGITTTGTTASRNVFNNIVYNFTGHDIDKGILVGDWTDGQGKVYNNTVYNIAGNGIEAETNYTDARNNISYNCGTDFSAGSHAFSATSAYNFSKDDTAPGTNSIHGTTDGKTPDFVSITASSENLHIQLTSDARGAGTSLSGTFTIDIDNQTRAGTWDIGADEIIDTTAPSLTADAYTHSSKELILTFDDNIDTTETTSASFELADSDSGGNSFALTETATGADGTALTFTLTDAHRDTVAGWDAALKWGGGWATMGGLSSGSGDDEFYSPYGVAVDGTHIYVLDSRNHRVVKRLKSDLSYVAKIGTSGSGNDNFSQPSGITCDDTHIYVADTFNNRVVKRLKSDLSYVAQIGDYGSGDDQFNRPKDITSDDTHIYTVEQYNYRVVKRLKSDLSYVAKIGTPGSGNDQFSQPSGITCDDTHIYVADTFNNRVVKRLKSDLSYVAQIGDYGSGDDQFKYPYGVAVDDTHIYVADSSNHRIHKRLKSDLSYVAQLGTGGSGDDQFNAPHGITSDDTHIYVGDSSNNRIVKIGSGATEATLYLAIAANGARDMSGNGNAAITRQAVDTWNKDTTAPGLTADAYTHSTKALVLTFNDKMDASAITYGSFELADAASAGNSFVLTSADVEAGTDGTDLTFTLTTVHQEAIAGWQAAGKTTLYLAIAADGAKDMSGNGNAAVTRQAVDTWTKDTTAPGLTADAYTHSTKELVLTFNDKMDASAITYGSFELADAASAGSSFVLTSADVEAGTDGTDLTFTLTTVHQEAIAGWQAAGKTTLYLAIAADGAKDMSGNGNAAVTRQAVDTWTKDTTAPGLTADAYTHSTKELVLTFNDKMDASAITYGSFELADAASAGSSFVLTSADVEAGTDGTDLTFTLTTVHQEAIAGWQAAGKTTLYLAIAANGARDMSGNGNAAITRQAVDTWNKDTTAPGLTADAYTHSTKALVLTFNDKMDASAITYGSFELADAAVAPETAYPTGNADMTGNVLLMHLNETGANAEEGGTISDTSGQGNTGTLYTGSDGLNKSTTGKLGGAIEFDGDDDYVKLPDAANPGISAYSVSAWIYWKGDNTDTSRTYQCIVICKKGSGLIFSVIEEGDGSNPKKIQFNSDIATYSLSDIEYNTWTHVAATYNDGGTNNIYIDGALDKSEECGTATASDQNNYIGTNQVNDHGWFNGIIDEVAIYNRALSPTEIADHYKRGALRLKYQVRSGSTNPPTGNFIGPDGTTTDYYEELDDNSVTLPSFDLTNVADNQYFQYKAYFETDNSSYSPELKSVVVPVNTDDTQVEFDAGAYNATQWDGVNNWLELDATGLTNGSGDYTSSVKDAGSVSSWDSIAWTPQRPTGKELSDNAPSAGSTSFTLTSADAEAGTDGTDLTFTLTDTNRDVIAGWDEAGITTLYLAIAADGAKDMSGNGNAAIARQAVDTWTKDTTSPNAPTGASFAATGNTVVSNYINNTNTGFIVSFTSPAAEYEGTAHLYAGGSLLATDVTVAVTAGSSPYNLTGNAQSITDLGADAAKILTVKIIDASGNVGAVSNNVNITVETVDPTFTISYWTDSGCTTSAFSGDYMKTGTYYIKITSNETLSGTPTISIAAEGTANDVSAAATSSISGNDYVYTRVVATDAAAVGTTAEIITITGTDVPGNMAANADVTGEKYTDTTAPAGGSISYADGGTASTTASITISEGSDSGGIASRALERASAAYTGDTAGGYSAFSNLTNPSEGAVSYDDTTLAVANAYMYRYVITDNAGNSTTYTSASEVKVEGAIASYAVTNTTPQTAGTGWSETVTALDINNNTVTSDSTTAVTMTNTISGTSDPGHAGFYADGNYDTTDATYTLTNGQATIYVKDTTAETITLTATDTNFKTGTSGNILVNPAATSYFTLSEPSDITAGTEATYTVTRYDEYGNLRTAGVQTVYLFSDSTGNDEFRETSAGTGVVSVDIADGQSAKAFYYYDDKVGDWTITASEATPANGPTGITDDTDAITVRHNTTDHLKFSANIPVPGPGFKAGTAFPLGTLHAVDLYGNLCDGANTATAYTGTGIEAKTIAYSLSGTDDAPNGTAADSYIYSVEFTGGVSTTTLTTTLYRAQPTTITANATDLSGTDEASNSITVGAGLPDQLSFSQQPSTTCLTNVALTNQPIAAVADEYGNTCTTGSDQITLAGSITNGAETPVFTAVTNGALSADALTVETSGGTAAFSGVKYTYPEQIYLRASGAGDYTEDYSYQITFSTASNDGTMEAGILSEPTDISSIVDTLEEKVDIFDFKITDSGTDGYGLVLTKIVITRDTNPSNPNKDTTGGWTDYIDAAYITDGTTSKLALSVTNDAITFGDGNSEIYTIANTAINGTDVSRTFTLSIYLEDSLPIGADGQTIAFDIDPNDDISIYTIDSIPISSGFAVGNSVTGSTDVEVTATKFIVTGSVASVAAGAESTISIKATDANNSIDMDYAGSPRQIVFSGATPAPSVAVPTYPPTCNGVDFGSPTGVNFVSGESSSTITMLLYKAEGASIKATEGSVTTSGADAHSIIVTGGDASELTWHTQPNDTVVGNAAWKAFKVSVTDAYGNISPESKTVTVTPTGAIFNSVTGTDEATAVSGIATFSNFRVYCASYPGLSVTLNATATGVTESGASSAVTVVERYNITIRVPDIVTGGDLDELTLTIRDPDTGVAVTGLTNPISGNSPLTDIYLPYGAYQFNFEKELYVELTVNKTASTAADGSDNSYDNNITWEVPMTSIAESLADYRVLTDFVYNEDDDILYVSARLERRGQQILDTTRVGSELQTGTLKIYDSDAVTAKYSASKSAADTLGNYWFIINDAVTSEGFGAGESYFAGITILYGSGVTGDASDTLNVTYSASTTFDIGVTARLKTWTEAIVEEVSDVKTKVGTEAGLTRTAVTTATSTITSDAATKAAATQATVTAEVDDAVTSLGSTISSTESTLSDIITIESASRILNQESYVRQNDTLTIRYKTTTGLKPVISVYDADNTLRVSAQTMSESVSGSGIYEYAVKFSWGRGEHTVICQETTKGTLDGINIEVISTDLEDISTTATTTMAKLANIDTDQISAFSASVGLINTVISSMINNIDELAGLSSKLGELAEKTTTTIYKELQLATEKLQEINEGQGVKIERMYELSEEQSTDVDYIKNKTLEIKALTELTQQIIERGSDEPIVKTWMELSGETEIETVPATEEESGSTAEGVIEGILEEITSETEE